MRQTYDKKVAIMPLWLHAAQSPSHHTLFVLSGASNRFQIAFEPRRRYSGPLCAYRVVVVSSPCLQGYITSQNKYPFAKACNGLVCLILRQKASSDMQPFKRPKGVCIIFQTFRLLMFWVQCYLCQNTSRSILFCGS